METADRYQPDGYPDRSHGAPPRKSHDPNPRSNSFEALTLTRQATAFRAALFVCSTARTHLGRSLRPDNGRRPDQHHTLLSVTVTASAVCQARSDHEWSCFSPVLITRYAGWLVPSLATIWRSLSANVAIASAPEGGSPLGVGGVDVLYRGLGDDAEHPYQVDGVGGAAGTSGR
jgi:hypothetical protein